jgi:hypothetical protein
MLSGCSCGTDHETETRDVTFPFFDGATSAFGFGPPHCTVSELCVSNLLTKAEIDDIHHLHRKPARWLARDRRKRNICDVAHTTQNGQEFLFESAVSH